jgi:Zn-dependent protease
MEQAAFPVSNPEQDPPVTTAPPPPESNRRVGWISGMLLGVGLVALKLKAVLLLAAAKFKLLLVNPFEGFGVAQFSWAAGSMIVSIAAYAVQMGLAFAIGFIVVLVLNEVGHAVMIRAKGLRAGAMVFIPFVGGAVTLKRQPRSAYTDAQIALAGPIAGALASYASFAIYRFSGNKLYLVIAHVGFLLNLFNLTPIGPLDGGRISAAITKWMWVLGGMILFVLTLKWPNPLMIVLIILSVFQIYRAIGEERRKRFYNVTVAQRGRIAAIYFTLLAFLAYETLRTFQQLAALRPVA